MPLVTRGLGTGDPLVTRGLAAFALAPDFLAALVAYWQGTPALAQLSPELYYGVAPGGKIWDDGAQYPFVTVTQIGSTTRGRNTGTAYWDERYYQFSLFHPNLAAATSMAAVMLAALDKIRAQPLVFADGYQMSWWRPSDTLRKIPGLGVGSTTRVHQQVYTYLAKLGRNP